MKELMEALTRAANAVAMHYEGTGGTFAAPAPVEKPLSEDVPAARKARAKKEPAADIGLDTPGRETADRTGASPLCRPHRPGRG